MERIRRQLTLFIDEPEGAIEQIRARFNPKQYDLIAAHITLCREDEIEPIEQTIARLKAIAIDKPLCIELGTAQRSSDGNGVFITGIGDYKAFKELRKMVLGQTHLQKEQVPHITLMHPRNATCDDDIFETILKYKTPKLLVLRKISLIEQVGDANWKILQEFDFVKK